MKRYIGTKILNAKPMTRAEWCSFRGWPLPADENGEDAGHLVEYTDGGKPNHPDFAGYISWSPADVFIKAYRETSGLTFGTAIEALKAGQRVARSGWNGKGMFLFIRPADKLNIRTVVDCVKTMPQGVKDYFDARDDRVNPGEFGLADIHFGAYICMVAADGSVVNGWLASQTDMLAEDWVVIA